MMAKIQFACGGAWIAGNRIPPLKKNDLIGEGEQLLIRLVEQFLRQIKVGEKTDWPPE